LNLLWRSHLESKAVIRGNSSPVQYSLPYTSDDPVGVKILTVHPKQALRVRHSRAVTEEGNFRWQAGCFKNVPEIGLFGLCKQET
jgi:hypothetical protein